MEAKDFITALVVVFLSLWGALYLETGLSAYFVLELFVILLLVLAATGILYGIASGKEWGWHALFAFFIVSIINSTAVYSSAKSVTPFALTLLANFGGILFIVSRKPGRFSPEEQGYKGTRLYHLDESDLVNHLETYEIGDSYAAKTGKTAGRKSRKSPKKKAKKKKPRKKR